MDFTPAASSRMQRGALIALLLGILALQVDWASLRCPLLDRFRPLPPEVGNPSRCARLTGPVGAEDAVVLEGSPTVLLLSELDGACVELTTAEVGGGPENAPNGAIWALELQDEAPRLTRLEVPLLQEHV